MANYAAGSRGINCNLGRKLDRARARAISRFIGAVASKQLVRGAMRSASDAGIGVDGKTNAILARAQRASGM